MRYAKIIGLSTLLLTGCATPYAKNGILGGFTERQLSENTYKVSFRGNGFTSDDRAGDFLLLRCADLALAHGAPYFRLVGSQDTSQNGAVVLPGTTTGTATANTYGNTTYVQGQTHTSPGFVAPIHFPRQTAMIELRGSQETAADVDAKLVSAQIRAEYGIK